MSLVELAEGLVRLCGRVAARAGCVLVPDDLHDADAESLSIIDYLTDHVASAGVLLVGALHEAPGAASDMVGAAGRRGVATVVAVRGLDDAAIAALVAARLHAPVDALPPGVLQQVVRAAGGNPMLAERLVDDLASGPGSERVTGPRPVDSGERLAALAPTAGT